MIWGGSGGFCGVDKRSGCGSGTVIWGIEWVECDEWAVWWLSASDSELSSDLCSGSSSLEDSCGTLYVPLGLRDTGCGNSGAVGGRGGGRFCCTSSSSVHQPNPYLFCLGAQSLALVLYAP